MKKPKKIWKIILLGTVILILALIVVFVSWASLSKKEADQLQYSSAISDTNVIVGNYDKFITIQPVNSISKNGFIFYPGALVNPEAYVWKFSQIAKYANVKIVIGRPPLNFAFLSINQAEDMYSAFPDIKNWYIGGHSLGGSMACLYASNNSEKLKGLILLGTYGGSDISKASLKVLSISGTCDGIFPPEKIEEERIDLPKDAIMVMVEGMNHAQIGNYGNQSGDNEPSITDDAALTIIKNSFKNFLNEN